MTSIPTSHRRGGPLASAHTIEERTEVELIWLEKQQEHWLRFGTPDDERRFDGNRRVLSFGPDTIFALVRWVSNDFGTILSRIDIVRTVAPGTTHQTLPFVRPGGEILLKIESWPKVERVLQMIDAIDRLGIEPEAVSPDHWRHIHHRLTAGQDPRAYTLGHHRAFLLRREAGQ